MIEYFVGPFHVGPRLYTLLNWTPSITCKRTYLEVGVQECWGGFPRRSLFHGPLSHLLQSRVFSGYEGPKCSYHNERAKSRLFLKGVETVGPKSVAYTPVYYDDGEKGSSVRDASRKSESGQ
jgi:hypothetical protein